MGTTISTLLPASQAAEGLQIVRALFAEWEQALSRFLAESELSRLNQRAGTPVVVSDLLYHVLTTALSAAQATQGMYDPSLHDQIVHLGYDRTFEDLPAIRFDPVESIEPGGGWRRIQVDAAHRTVTIPIGARLDFGGIAKGMAVDAALEQLRRNGISPALVNAGGDLAVLGLPPGEQQWPIAVPGRDKDWTIPLHHGAVATSGIAYRRWWQGHRLPFGSPCASSPPGSAPPTLPAGKTLRHHLLDPRTGLSAQSDLWSVTVVTDRCEQGEVAAKVAFILGSRAGADFLRKHQIAGLLVREDGTWETVEPWPAHLMSAPLAALPGGRSKADEARRFEE